MALLSIFLAVCLFFVPPLYGNDIPVEVRSDDMMSLDSLLMLPINTVSKSWQSLRVAPASVTIITGQDIEKFGYRTIKDVVHTVRGFYTNYDRSYSYVGVRGFGRLDEYNSRLLVLLNGHYMNDNVLGVVGVGSDLSFNVDAIERIEVIRGPGSVMYGTGAMFAVINIVTKTGRDLNGVAVSVEGGSFGYKQGSIQAGTAVGDVDMTVAGTVGDATGQDVYLPEYDTATTNFGIAHNLDGLSYYSLFGKISYGLLTLQGYTNFREKFIPTAPFGTIFNYPNVRAVNTYNIFEASYGIELHDNALLTLRGSYNALAYRANFPFASIDSSGNPIVVTFWENYSNKWLGAEARLQWDIWANNRLIVGAEGKYNILANRDSWLEQEQIYKDSLSFTTWSMYVQNEYQVMEDINVTAAMRLDYYPEDGRAISSRESGISISPKLGVIANVTPTTVVKLLYSSGFRTPIFNDRTSENSSGQQDTTVLETERVNSWELVAEQQIGRDWYIVGSVYDNYIKNVEKEFLAPEDSTLSYWPLTNIRAVGAEVEINARLASGTRGYGSYSLQTMWDEDDATLPSNSPKHLIKFGLSQTVAKVVNVSLEAQYESSRYTLQHTTTGAYTTTTARIAYRPLPMVEVSLLVRNLLNTTYSLPTGWGNKHASITQDGRNAIAKIRLEL